MPLDLFPDFPADDPASPALRAAREEIGKAAHELKPLHQMDRLAVAHLIEAPHVPLMARFILDSLRRVGDVAGRPFHGRNRLAQIAARRWHAAGLRVSGLHGSFDIVPADEWLRALPLAPELAAEVAKLHG